MANTRQMEPEDLVEDEGLEGEGIEDTLEEHDAPVPEESEASAAEYDVQPALSMQESLGILSRIKWGRVALACIFAFLVLAAALFVWNRWYRFDDIADIQGTWRDVNSGATMEVNATHIKIAEDAAYEYTIDITAKTIHYSFGGNEGFSSYRFSEDRQKLVLEDGVETDWGLVFHFRDDPGFAEGELAEGMTRLEKTSNDIPTIKLPGSSRPAGELVQSEPQKPVSSSSNAASQNAVSSTEAVSSLGKDASGATSSKPKASQTEPDENGYIVGPDRNAKGYYDDQGIFVPVSYGHFDDTGEWIDDGAGGYLDAEGNWIEGPTGYYDGNGSWVDYAAQAQESANGGQGSGNAEGGSEGSGYYDQYGNWVDTSSWGNKAAADNVAGDGNDGEEAGYGTGDDTYGQYNGYDENGEGTDEGW